MVSTRSNKRTQLTSNSEQDIPQLVVALPKNTDETTTTTTTQVTATGSSSSSDHIESPQVTLIVNDDENDDDDDDDDDDFEPVIYHRRRRLPLSTSSQQQQQRKKPKTETSDSNVSGLLTPPSGVKKDRHETPSAAPQHVLECANIKRESSDGSIAYELPTPSSSSPASSSTAANQDTPSEEPDSELENQSVEGADLTATAPTPNLDDVDDSDSSEEEVAPVWDRFHRGRNGTSY
ncbi:hypothetical protein BC941DRAFT_449229 [Chlamydoabsidia padenii]|nr:hypothetical protein BC941DRAFT_449229 [Chlamydoabsidia padenii]